MQRALARMATTLANLFEKAPIRRINPGGVLDRSAFSRQIDLLSVPIPAAKTTHYRKLLQSALLKKPRLSNITNGKTAEERVLLLSAAEKSQLPSEILTILENEALSPEIRSVTLGYDYWTADEILQATLPEELCDESPTSFATVGHIAHLNLRSEYLPYKNLIGEVILDKNANIKTVVNKLDTINNEFRFFEMEVLAGEPNFTVELSESSCRFRFDFSKVYWNSRLSTEHERLVSTFEPEDVVADGFAGVGPFAIPAAKRGCAVLANDLNPSSTDALKDNVRLNKVDDQVRVWTMDAAPFFRKAVEDAFLLPFPPYTKRKTQKEIKQAAKQESNEQRSTPGAQRQFINHFVMNLPATAIEFLGVFNGLYRHMAQYEGFRAAANRAQMPTVHCYCFSKETPENAFEDVCTRASKYLGVDVKNAEIEDLACTFVRSVAPAKDMYRLSFRPSIRLLFGEI